MKERHFSFLVTMLVSFMIVISGCGGGGGGGDEPAAPQTTPEVSSYTISGTVYDGVLAGAIILVKKPDGTLLGSGTSGSNGDYQITVEDYTGPVVIEVDPDNGGIDQDTNSPNRLKLSNVCYLDTNCTENVTPVTSFLYHRLGGNDYTKAEIDSEKSALASALGFGAGFQLDSIPAADTSLKQKMTKIATLAKVNRMDNNQNFFQLAANKISAGNPLFSGINLNDSFVDTNFPLPLKTMKQVIADDMKANPDQIDASKRLMLSGKITDFQTQNPIEGATIEIIGLGISSATDVEGVYSLITQINSAYGDELVISATASGYAKNQKTLVFKPVTSTINISFS